MKAIWNDVILAESDDIITVEGNSYFPRESLNMEYFTESNTNTFCPWKGKAHYMSIIVNGKKNDNCAWYYPKPSLLAKKIKNRVAFWNGVSVN